MVRIEMLSPYFEHPEKEGDETNKTKRPRDDEDDATEQPPPRPTKKQRARIDEQLLSEDQQEALQRFVDGRNLFITGEAGTGKSYLLGRIIKRAREIYGRSGGVHVTSSTGVSATDIGGRTLHSFAGIGLGIAEPDVEYKNMKGPTKQRWRRARCLIVDEISMITGEYLDKLNYIAKRVRRCDDPFGGIQLVFCGDFLQLAPVFSPAARLFAFESEAWKETIVDRRNIAVLRTTFRQSEGDSQDFLHVLRAIRYGRMDQRTRSLLESRVCKAAPAPDPDGIEPTIIHTHRMGTDRVNQGKLDKLDGLPKLYNANDDFDSKNAWMQERLNKSCLAQPLLKVKVGAQVMFLKNDSENGLNNGSRGVVIRFDDFEEHNVPVVRFKSGQVHQCTRKQWNVEDADGKVLASRKQIPLLLAWSLTSHKVQGMTLDLVHFMLDKSFAEGQVYVGMSRCRRLSDLTISCVPSLEAIKPNARVLAYYQKIGA